MVTNQQLLWVTVFTACVSGCVPGEVEDDAGVPSCVPDATTYEEEIAPLIDTYCAQCHSSPPVAAPFSLVSYSALLAPYGGARVVDALPAALANRLMPPRSLPQPSDAELQQLIDWAICSE